MVIPLAPDLRFPGAPVSLDHVTFSYTAKQRAVLRDVSLSIHMGSHMGIVGLNGSGKSTLVKLVTDVLSPTKGTVSRHPRLKLGYYSQLAVEDLRAAGTADPSMTALSTLAAEAGEEMEEDDMRGLLSSFHLVGDTTSSVPVSQLSGGQLVRVRENRSSLAPWHSLISLSPMPPTPIFIWLVLTFLSMEVRLALACIIWKHAHLLVLDEVTTHLDFYTVQALGTALRVFDGALLIVSHDRFLVESVIEGYTELLQLDEDNGSDDEEEESKAEQQRSLHLLEKEAVGEGCARV